MSAYRPTSTSGPFPPSPSSPRHDAAKSSFQSHPHDGPLNASSFDNRGVGLSDHSNHFPATPKTQYHSLFYRLLTWKNSRDSAIAFVASIFLIAANRYVNIMSYVFKFLYIILGAATAAEITGKVLMGEGITTRIRPLRYKTIRPDSLQRFCDDIADVINFFVVGFQQVVFAENVYVTGAAFVASFISYWFVRYLPFWALVLAADCVAFMGPLVYLKNKRMIDSYLDQTAAFAQEKANQLKTVAGKHVETAASSIQSAASPYAKRISSLGSTQPVTDTSKPVNLSADRSSTISSNPATSISSSHNARNSTEPSGHSTGFSAHDVSGSSGTTSIPPPPPNPAHNIASNFPPAHSDSAGLASSGTHPAGPNFSPTTAGTDFSRTAAGSDFSRHSKNDLSRNYPSAI